MTTDQQTAVETIERMYAALGVDDRPGLDGMLSEDFHAFENGVAMSGRELLDLLSQDYAAGKRYRWSVTEPQVEIDGDFGAVVYVNHGSIVESAGTEPIPLSWLETVLLRRDGARWRVAFLHSTRTKATSAT